jgi:streptogramin lyase
MFSGQRPDRRLVRAVLACLVVAASLVPALATAAVAEQRPRLTEFPLPTATARPYGIVAGPNGALWFTESAGNKIGELSPGGRFREFDLPIEGSNPEDITVGPDGSLWFTETGANLIGRLTPGGHMREFPVPSGFADPKGIAAAPDGTIWFAESSENSRVGILTPPLGYIEELDIPDQARPQYLAAGPDGNMWFTGELSNTIGRIRLSDRKIQEWTVPTENAAPWNIAAGPDGNMWFTELTGRSIGRITMRGEITEFPIPYGFGSVTGITPGFDGNLWFTQSDDRSVGSITPSGTFLASIPTGDSPTEIAAGADGNLWITERGGSNAIARLSAARAGAASAISWDVGFVPAQVQTALGGSVTWLFQGPNAHSVTDDLGLFDSSEHWVGAVATLAFPYAGTFGYHDSTDPSHTGSVGVPTTAPTTGTVGQPFPVTWATAAPPAGFAFDVQVRTPGSATWSDWQQDVVTESADYTPAETGTYQFRAAVEDLATLDRSGWSAPARVEVGTLGAASVQGTAARRFWERHGYLVPDPAAYDRLKARASVAANRSEPYVSSSSARLPRSGPSFKGVRDPNMTPPDPNGAIGPHSFMEVMNLQIGIWDRTGTLITRGPFVELVGGNQYDYTDPQILWDPDTQRFYFNVWDYTSATMRWGFSKSDDPRTLGPGDFCTYVAGFGYHSFDAPDYPHLGQTKDFLLLGVNFFRNFETFEGGDLLWIEKPQGSGPIADCPSAEAFHTGRIAALTNEDGSLVDAPQPAQQVDPSGTGWVVGIPYSVFGTGDFISVFEVSKDAVTGRPILGEGRSLPVPGYDIPPYAVQCGADSPLLDTLDGRLERAVSAIDPTTGATEIWTAHAVLGGAGSEERWYEITPDPSGPPALAQSGAATDPSLDVWNGAVAPDRTVSPAGAAHGDAMVMGFNTSSPSACASLAMVSKVGSAPQSPFVLVKGRAAAFSDFSCVPICRWGDFSSAAPDPGASLTSAHGAVWLAGEIPVGRPVAFAGTWIWKASP